MLGLLAAVPVVANAGGALLFEELKEHREKWEAAAIDHYELVSQYQCFCPTDLTVPVLVVVKDGRVDSATYAETVRDPNSFQTFRRGAPLSDYHMQHIVVTVPDLFGHIRRSLIRGDDGVFVTFDDDLGYPVNTRFDPEASRVDDESGWWVRRLSVVRFESE